jgi:hypothetical protein
MARRCALDVAGAIQPPERHMIYDRTIPVLLHGLTALEGVLTKAEAHFSAKKVDPAVVMGLRLYPDMLPFSRQVQICADHARRGANRLAGAEPAAVPDTEATIGELKARLAMSRDVVKATDRKALEGAETRSITLKTGGRDITFSGSDYVGLFMLPNFYFHMTTAYNILRHGGVEIGKRDFLGG